jgi:hypothetical protein
MAEADISHMIANPRLPPSRPTLGLRARTTPAHSKELHMNPKQEMLLHELRAVLATDRPEINGLPIDAVHTQANLSAYNHRRRGDQPFASYLHKLITEFWNANSPSEGTSK